VCSYDQTNQMKYLLIICTILLFLALADLPIGYYTFLRITVTIGAVAVVISEFENGFNFWVIAFGILVILFNPLNPVYLNDKDVWIPIDIIAGTIFLTKSITYKTKTNE